MDLERMLEKCHRDQWTVGDLDWTTTPRPLTEEDERRVVQYFTDMACIERMAGALFQEQRKKVDDPTLKEVFATFVVDEVRHSHAAQMLADYYDVHHDQCYQPNPAMIRFHPAFVDTPEAPLAGHGQHRHHHGRGPARHRPSPLTQRLRERRHEPPGHGAHQPGRVAPPGHRLLHDGVLRLGGVRGEAAARPSTLTRRARQGLDRLRAVSPLRVSLLQGGLLRPHGHWWTRRASGWRRPSSGSSCS